MSRGVPTVRDAAPRRSVRRVGAPGSAEVRTSGRHAPTSRPSSRWCGDRRRPGGRPATVDDLVQETLVRVLAAAARIEPGMLEPYAIVTARNVVASMWRDEDRQRRNQHRVVDLTRRRGCRTRTCSRGEEQAAVAAGAGPPVRARAGDPARARGRRAGHPLAGARDSARPPGAVAAQLNRTRARLRVEYLLALEQAEPPTDRCRPVLLALSGGDRRRQREVDAARHLLECELCAAAEPAAAGARAQPRTTRCGSRSRRDADIVTARQAARELGGPAGLLRRPT